MADDSSSIGEFQQVEWSSPVAKIKSKSLFDKLSEHKGDEDEHSTTSDVSNISGYTGLGSILDKQIFMVDAVTMSDLLQWQQQEGDEIVGAVHGQMGSQPSDFEFPAGAAKTKAKKAPKKEKKGTKNLNLHRIDDGDSRRDDHSVGTEKESIAEASVDELFRSKVLDTGALQTTDRRKSRKAITQDGYKKVIEQKDNQDELSVLSGLSEFDPSSPRNPSSRRSVQQTAAFVEEEKQETVSISSDDDSSSSEEDPEKKAVNDIRSMFSSRYKSIKEDSKDSPADDSKDNYKVLSTKERTKLIVPEQDTKVTPTQSRTVTIDPMEDWQKELEKQKSKDTANEGSPVNEKRRRSSVKGSSFNSKDKQRQEESDEVYETSPASHSSATKKVSRSVGRSKSESSSKSRRGRDREEVLLSEDEESRRKARKKEKRSKSKERDNDHTDDEAESKRKSSRKEKSSRRHKDVEDKDTDDEESRIHSHRKSRRHREDDEDASDSRKKKDKKKDRKSKRKEDENSDDEQSKRRSRRNKEHREELNAEDEEESRKREKSRKKEKKSKSKKYESDQSDDEESKHKSEKKDKKSKKSHRDRVREESDHEAESFEERKSHKHSSKSKSKKGHDDGINDHGADKDRKRRSSSHKDARLVDSPKDPEATDHDPFNPWDGANADTIINNAANDSFGAFGAFDDANFESPDPKGSKTSKKDRSKPKSDEVKDNSHSKLHMFEDQSDCGEQARHEKEGKRSSRQKTPSPQTSPEERSRRGSTGRSRAISRSRNKSRSPSRSRSRSSSRHRKPVESEVPSSLLDIVAPSDVFRSSDPKAKFAVPAEILVGEMEDEPTSPVTVLGEEKRRVFKPSEIMEQSCSIQEEAVSEDDDAAPRLPKRALSKTNSLKRMKEAAMKAGDGVEPTRPTLSKRSSSLKRMKKAAMVEGGNEKTRKVIRIKAKDLHRIKKVAKRESEGQVADEDSDGENSYLPHSPKSQSDKPFIDDEDFWNDETVQTSFHLKKVREHPVQSLYQKDSRGASSLEQRLKKAKPKPKEVDEVSYSSRPSLSNYRASDFEGADRRPSMVKEPSQKLQRTIDMIDSSSQRKEKRSSSVKLALKEKAPEPKRGSGILRRFSFARPKASQKYAMMDEDDDE